MKPRRLVRDWMTTGPVTANVNTSLPEAHELMIEKQVRRLPVLDHGKMVGIVTRGDVRGAQASDATSLSAWELNYLLSNLKLSEIMTREVISVSPDTPVREAAQIMLDNKIAGLPVVDDGELVGIITESDIFRMLVENWETEREPALA